MMSLSAHELAMTMIREVLYTTGITATAGIGTNLYLCKIAMDAGPIPGMPMEPGIWTITPAPPRPSWRS